MLYIGFYPYFFDDLTVYCSMFFFLPEQINVFYSDYVSRIFRQYSDWLEGNFIEYFLFQ